MSFKEELKAKADNMAIKVYVQPSGRDATNKKYMDLVEFKKNSDRDIFDRLPLGEYQKQMLVYKLIEEITGFFISDKWSRFKGNSLTYPVVINMT